MEELRLYLYKLSRLLVIILLSLTTYYLINIGNNFVNKEKKINIRKETILKLVAASLGVFGLYKLFLRYSILADTLYTIIISIVIAYLLNPLVNYLEELGIKNRLHSVVLIYLIILAMVLVFAFLILPSSSREVKSFIYNMPKYLNKTTDVLDKTVNKYEEMTGNIPFISDRLKESLAMGFSGIEELLTSWIKSFFNVLYSMLSRVISLVLTPILTLYFLVDKDYFIGKIIGLIPEKYREDFIFLSREVNKSLSMFVRGRLIMAAYVGVSISLVLIVFRVNFALAIGFITGFADIIPYIGPFLGFIPAVFFAFLDSPTKALWVSILFLFIQWTENNILAPKILGESTGLHPMTVLLAIVIGGGMFGVFGMIFSIPFISVIIILYKFFIEKLDKDLDYKKLTKN